MNKELLSVAVAAAYKNAIEEAVKRAVLEERQACLQLLEEQRQRCIQAREMADQRLSVFEKYQHAIMNIGWIADMIEAKGAPQWTKTPTTPSTGVCVLSPVSLPKISTFVPSPMVSLTVNAQAKSLPTVEKRAQTP